MHVFFAEGIKKKFRRYKICLYDVCKLFYCIMKYLPMDTSRTPQNLSNLTQSRYCKICVSRLGSIEAKEIKPISGLK